MAALITLFALLATSCSPSSPECDPQQRVEEIREVVARNADLVERVYVTPRGYEDGEYIVPRWALLTGDSLLALPNPADVDTSQLVEIGYKDNIMRLGQMYGAETYRASYEILDSLSAEVIRVYRLTGAGEMTSYMNTSGTVQFTICGNHTVVYRADTTNTSSGWNHIRGRSQEVAKHWYIYTDE